MNLADLERILRQGAASLAEGLNVLRLPSPSASLEANVALQLGRGLLNAGFLTYAEAYGAGRTNLFAIHPAKGALVVAEVKRLDGHGGTGSVLYDRARLATFALPDGAPRLGLVPRYGILAGTSANREYARWFTTMQTGPIAPTGELAALEEQLPPDTIWNGYALSDVADAAGQRRTEWLLYALFQQR